MLTAVGVILLSLVALLAIPVTLSFQLSWPKGVQQVIELQWAFGLIRTRIPSPQSGTDVPESSDLGQRADRIQHTAGGSRNAFFIVRQQAFRQRIIKFVRDLWHAVHKKDISLHVRVGLGDPADTGQLWAVAGPVAGMLASLPQSSITIEPEFLDTTFELDSSGRIRFIPLQLIYLTIALFLSPPVWRGMKQMRVARR